LFYITILYVGIDFRSIYIYNNNTRVNYLDFNENKDIKINLDDFKVMFKHELSYIIEYFDFNLQKLEERKKELDNFLELDIQENPTLEYGLRGMYHLDYLKIPSYFYHSSIVTLYSLLENNLSFLCIKIQADTNLVIGLNDLTGHNLLEKARSFLVKVANIDFENVDKEWIRISDFQKLRNLIVHNNSQIKDRDSFEKLLKKFNGIKTYELQNDFHIIDIKLIREFLSVIENFINKIILQIEERTFKQFRPASFQNSFYCEDDFPF